MTVFIYMGLVIFFLITYSGQHPVAFWIFMFALLLEGISLGFQWRKEKKDEPNGIG